MKILKPRMGDIFLRAMKSVSRNYWQSVYNPKQLMNRTFFLWLCGPILGLGRLHKTSRFISVTRSRTVGRTPWTGDQFVARPLLTAPGEGEDGEVGAMNGFWQGKVKY
jgi:hypothetical protein